MRAEKGSERVYIREEDQEMKKGRREGKEKEGGEKTRKRRKRRGRRE